MDTRKWLKRKYPKTFNELNEYFDYPELKLFKDSTLKIGRLNKDLIVGRKYVKDEIIQFRRSNPINDYNYPLVYCITKCPAEYTESGYHSFFINESDFIEVFK